MDSPLLPSISRHPQGHPPPSFNLFDTSLESLKLQDLSFTDDRSSQKVGSSEQPSHPSYSSNADDISFDTPPKFTRPVGHRKQGPPPPAGLNRTGAGKPRFSLFAQPMPEPTPAAPVEPVARKTNPLAGSGGKLKEEEEDDDEEEEGRAEEAEDETVQVNGAVKPKVHRHQWEDDRHDQYSEEEEDGQRHEHADGVEGDEDDDGQTLRLSELASSTGLAEEREATLKKTLFDLQRLNGAFEGYIGALESNNAFHSRIADQTMFTNSLLDDYIHILSASQKVASLVQNPQWEGAEADERAGMARQMALLQAQEQAMREAAIRAEAKAAELQRRQELKAEEVRAAALAASVAESRTGRGGAVSRGRGRGVGTGAGASGIPTSSSSSAASGGRGKIPTYSGVRSSGYGPPPKKK